MAITPGGTTPTIDQRRAEDAVAIPAPPKLKRCKGPCQMIIEFDPERVGEFFDVDTKNKDGFKRICKSCRSEQRLVKKIAERNQRLQHIDQRIVGLLNQARPGGTEVPHIAEVFSKIVQLMGGANGLAMSVVQTYVQAPPGSPTRQKMLAHILHVAKSTTDSGAAKVPLEMLNEEELEAEIIRRDRARGIVTSMPPKLQAPEIDEDDSDLNDSTEDDDDTEDHG